MDHRCTIAFTAFLAFANMGLHAQAWADAGPDQWVCGDSTSLQAAPLLPLDTGFWFVSQGNATFADPSDPATAVTDLVMGENVFQWVLINNFGATSDFVSIWSYDPLAPVADAGPDQTLYSPPNVAYLNANAYQAPCTCSWTIVAGNAQLQSPTSPTSSLIWSAPNVAVLRWTCVNGACGITSDDVTVEWVLGTGTEKPPEQTERLIFHDPAHDRLVLPGLRSAGSVEILTSGGQVARRFTYGPGTNAWSTADLPEGLYIARVAGEGEVQIMRFLVNR